MTFNDIFKSSFLENVASVSILDMAIALLLAFGLGTFIFLVYKKTYQGVMYSSSFGTTLIALTMITTVVILAVTSNVVLSLGMVGALSIIRFRTAIKDPMDLVFLFWSISIGIICGAGLYEVALVTSVAVTVCILVLDLLPVAKAPMMLVVNSSVMDAEEAVLEIVRKYTKTCKVKSRNLSRDRLDMVVELRVEDESGLVREVAGLEGMISASLIAHDGEVTF